PVQHAANHERQFDNNSFGGGQAAVTQVRTPTEQANHSEQQESRTQWVGADSILFATAHRPWPAPMAPWIMTQRWNVLLFLHYALTPEVVRPLVPEMLTLDTYKQRAGCQSLRSGSIISGRPECHRCHGFRILPKSMCAPTSRATGSPACISSAWTPAICRRCGVRECFIACLTG